MSNVEQPQLQPYNNMADTDAPDASAGRLVDSGEINNSVSSVEIASGSDVVCRSTKTSSNANSFRIEALLASKEHENTNSTGADLSPIRAKANTVDLSGGDGFNASDDRHSRGTVKHHKREARI
uniref:Uncharacterized protein n=1 Tax=Anopheles maculatus TaxID=74869 RepID=A0A182SFM1_9DIPT